MRNVLSVLAGMAVWTALTLSVNATLMALFPERFDEQGITTSAGLLILVLVLSVLYSVAAGFTTAKLARERGRAMVRVLAGIHLLLGIGVQASVWELMPVWFHLPFLAFVVPAHLAGGSLGTSER